MSAARRLRHNAFEGIGLDRVSERRGDTAWVEALLRAPTSRFVVVDAEGRVLCDADGGPAWLNIKQCAQRFAEGVSSLLGLASDTAYFLWRLPGGGAAAVGEPWLGLRALAGQADAFAAGLCAYACGLAHWQAGMRYCPACATPLVWHEAGHRAACTDPQCGRLQFPRTDPAIIVIVEHDGACLLGRQASWDQGRFSTLAGFVEPGESLEDAVRREVSEEAGVEVTGCDYFASQPWPFPASLMLGFTAVAAAKTLELRDGELAEAGWFTVDDIMTGVRAGHLKLSSPLSVSWHLLDHWMQGQGAVSLRQLAPSHPH